MSAFGGSTSLIQSMAAIAAQSNASIRNCNDVSLTNPQSNDTLAYNALANVWVNQPLTIIRNNDTLITNPPITKSSPTTAPTPSGRIIHFILVLLLTSPMSPSPLLQMAMS